VRDLDRCNCHQSRGDCAHSSRRRALAVAMHSSTRRACRVMVEMVGLIRLLLIDDSSALLA